MTERSVRAGWSKCGPISRRFSSVPHTEREYEALVALLDALIDRVGEDETRPLASLMEVVGSLIERVRPRRACSRIG